MNEHGDQRASVEERTYLLPFHVCREHYGALDVFPSVKLVPGQLSRNRYYVELPRSREREARIPVTLCEGLLLPIGARHLVQVEILGGESMVGVEESPRGFKYKLYFATVAKASAAMGPKRPVPACIRAISWTPGENAFSTREYVPIELLSEAGVRTEIRAALGARRGFAEDARAQRVLDACMEMVALCGASSFYAFRVRAPEEGRHWIDFKLDERHPVTLRDVGRRMFDVASALGTNAALCADWLRMTEGDLLSHLSVGSSGDGSPFVTLYNDGRRRKPPPYSKHA